MKKYLVLYDQNWIKNELPTPRSKKYCSLVFRKVSFKDAPIIQTVDGSKIDDKWILSQVPVLLFDGVILAMNGDKLNGRNGVHIKKMVFGTKKFSVMQVEAKRGVYRVWKLGKDGKWFLDSTKRRTKETYKQLHYTFDHEIGHSLKYLNGEVDDLHVHITRKQYEEWWQKQV